MARNGVILGGLRGALSLLAVFSSSRLGIVQTSLPSALAPQRRLEALEALGVITETAETAETAETETETTETTTATTAAVTRC